MLGDAADQVLGPAPVVAGILASTAVAPEGLVLTGRGVAEAQLRGSGRCPPGRSDPKHSGPGALYLTRRLVWEGAASHHRSGSDVT